MSFDISAVACERERDYPRSAQRPADRNNPTETLAFSTIEVGHTFRISTPFECLESEPRLHITLAPRRDFKAYESQPSLASWPIVRATEPYSLGILMGDLSTV
jgi:hypothetical protein